jgi:CheY-like chemotaxis protein
MSHEFRTPVNSIASLSGLLLSRLDGDLTPEQEKQVLLIRTAAQTLLELANDLLDLARVEAGKATLQPATFPLTRVFTALRGMLRPLIAQSEVRLVFEDPPEDLELFTDEGKLSQILRNFVSNALKFTEAGEVRVTSAVRLGDLVAIAVRDTGIGIAPEDQDRIYREFEQVQNRAQSRHKGTGLGLPLSRKLAELLGGRVELQSAPDAGSTFTVVIPRVLSQSGPEPPLEPIPAALRARSILIVDDDDTARYVVRHEVAGLATHVREARDGEEGWRMCREALPDLVILDLVMPRLTGFQFVERLRQTPETKTIRVVVCTSHVLSGTDQAQLEQHVSAVISKESLADPAQPRRLRELVSKLLNSY